MFHQIPSALTIIFPPASHVAHTDWFIKTFLAWDVISLKLLLRWMDPHSSFATSRSNFNICLPIINSWILDKCWVVKLKFVCHEYYNNHPSFVYAVRYVYIRKDYGSIGAEVGDTDWCMTTLPVVNNHHTTRQTRPDIKHHVFKYHFSTLMFSVYFIKEEKFLYLSFLLRTKRWSVL